MFLRSSCDGASFINVRNVRHGLQSTVVRRQGLVYPRKTQPRQGRHNDSPGRKPRVSRQTTIEPCKGGVKQRPDQQSQLNKTESLTKGALIEGLMTRFHLVPGLAPRAIAVSPLQG